VWYTWTGGGVDMGQLLGGIPHCDIFSWANLLYMVVAHHLSVVRGCIRLTVRCPTLLKSSPASF